MNIAETRLAATVVLLRDGPQGPEVFMVRRHHQIDFAGGALVFPGGKVAPEDIHLAQAHVPDDPLGAFRLAAIRELFEETGLLLAESVGGARGTSAEPMDRLRTELVQAGIDFPVLLERLGMRPTPGALLPFAHWITPEMVPKRFDTHFFLARMSGETVLSHDGGETVDSLWITPREALSAAQEGRHTIIWPTRMNLQKLAQHDTVDALWNATRAAPVVTVLPRLVQTPQGQRMRIPEEAGYPEWEVDLATLMGAAR
ncbi:MAG TPA: NUDIX hydrolase [Candidatus Acidoferrales bacterium]|nr:NUDIX hydrolase [Candidatus Acidoferrales bacterium]